MPRASRQNPAIREFILRHVSDHPDTIGALTAKEFGLSRTSVSRTMQRLVAEGVLMAEGKTNARQYELMTLAGDSFQIKLFDGLSEDAIWRHRVLPFLNGIPRNIIDICQYGFTEMLNNAVDHSVSEAANIIVARSCADIWIAVNDSGVGIFEKIRRDFSLEDRREALLELSKGKLTSDKKRHSGEGIFFTSRMFDWFCITSGGLSFYRTHSDDDGWLMETQEGKETESGTSIKMKIYLSSTRTTREVFKTYQGDTLRFRKTHVPIKLANYPGEQLVSRSQAKRILARFDQFSEVLLDFEGVPDIGQPFADEIFRVFPLSHPEIKLIAVKTSPEVEEMIAFVKANQPQPD